MVNEPLVPHMQKNSNSLSDPYLIWKSRTLSDFIIAEMPKPHNTISSLVRKVSGSI